MYALRARRDVQGSVYQFPPIARHPVVGQSRPLQVEDRKVHSTVRHHVDTHENFQAALDSHSLCYTWDIVLELPSISSRESLSSRE